MVILCQAFFSAFGQKLDLPKNPKTRFFPKKLDFRRQKLDFLDKFFYNLALLAPQNCNDSQNQSKKAYFRPENCQKSKNLALKCKNLI